jgi:hypothetical protein
MATGEVNAGDLQVTSVDVALVERYCIVGCYLLVCTATLES